MNSSRASLIVVAVDERSRCFENRGNRLMQQYSSWSERLDHDEVLLHYIAEYKRSVDIRCYSKEYIT